MLFVLKTGFIEFCNRDLDYKLTLAHKFKFIRTHKFMNGPIGVKTVM